MKIFRGSLRPNLEFIRECFAICLVIGRVQSESAIPLVIATNRDEFYDRKSEIARVRTGNNHDFLAPLDCKGGGTWLGINETGLFTALTNPLERNKQFPRSRGEIVQTILGDARSFSDVRELADDLNPGEYGPFSLVTLLPEGVLAVSSNGNEIATEEHGTGDLVLSSEKGLELFEPEQWERFPWRRRSRRDQEEPEKLRARLQEFCKRSEPFRHRDSVCRKGEDAGTVSSTVILIEEFGPNFIFDYADGPPDTTAYRNISPPRAFTDSIIQRWI